MPAFRYHPGLTGSTLESALGQVAHVRPALIEGLLYANSVLLVSADAGVGKSTILINALAQASVGLPVFQALYVPRPLRCYYIPFERGTDEVLERLYHIRQSILFNPENLIIFHNPYHASLNLYDPRDQQGLLDSIAKDCGAIPPDVVAYDPIYQAVAGGLCNEDKVSIFIRFNVQLMATFGCATWLNHHTGKPIYNQGGSIVEKDDPYYGSSYLRNHCTGSYYLKKNAEGDGTILLKKKDNLDTLLDKMILHYNPESYTSYIKENLGGLSVSDRLNMVFRKAYLEGQKLTFRQIQGCLMGVSTSHLRRLIETAQTTEFIKKHKSNGEPTLYEVLHRF